MHIVSLFKYQLIFVRLNLVLLLLFSACTNKSNKAAVTIIPKKIPSNYLNAIDTNFSNHQDTIYFKGLKFSGFQFALFLNGDTAFIKSYLNGLEEGTHKKWYNNKQLAEQRTYANGKKEGGQQAWWPDGKQKFIYTASDDAFTGELKEWNSAGLLNKDFNYINGQEEGSEKMWWDDGTIRANYVIRNGKKYGLLGIKICVNRYGSINKK